MAAFAFVAAACDTGERALSIADYEEFGPVAQPQNVLSRDGGAAGILGDRYLWTFGQTRLAEPAADGAASRPNSAALAPVHAPLRATEPLDDAGAPFALIRRTDSEADRHASDGHPQIALRPTGVVSASRTRHYIIYLKSHVTDITEGPDRPNNQQVRHQHVGLAAIDPGQTVARRLPQPLFEAPAPLPRNPLVDGDWLYLYGSLHNNDEPGPVVLARASRFRTQDVVAYRYWDGSTWVRDPQDAVSVLEGVPGQMSVSYNRHLRQYLAVHSAPVQDAIVFRTAERPQGPWSEPTYLRLADVVQDMPQSPYPHRDAREQPELASADGRTIAISFFRPTGPDEGQMILAFIELE